MLKKHYDPAPDCLPYYLTEGELAKRLKVSVRTLQNQRGCGKGIPFVKIGRSVRYELTAVEDYLNSQRRLSTSSNGGGVQS